MDKQISAEEILIKKLKEVQYSEYLIEQYLIGYKEKILSAMEEYANQFSQEDKTRDKEEDKIAKAIEWCGERIEQHTKGSPSSIKALNPLDAFREAKQFIKSLK